MLVTAQQLMLTTQLCPASQEGKICAISTHVLLTNIMIIMLLFLVQKEL